jgi:hypothetical protein
MKAIKQISVFIENEPGRLARITNVLKDHGINMRALSIAESGEFGIIRFIVDRPKNGYKILDDAGFTVTETNVLGVKMQDVPGSLANVANVLGQNGINIEYCYAFTIKGEAILILKVDDEDKAISVLNETQKLLNDGDVYGI